jgi:DNA-binding response OmpR family regulator
MQENEVSLPGGLVYSPLRCQASPPHRILVVDDDTAIRQLNAEMLLRSGYTVKMAEDGAAAWNALGEDQFDLMITDHKMPKVTGVELLNKLHRAKMPLPVIMVTAEFPHQEFAMHPWLRPPATLLKPYTVAEMLRTVKDVLCRAAAPDGVNSSSPWQSAASPDGMQF